MGHRKTWCCCFLWYVSLVVRLNGSVTESLYLFAAFEHQIGRHVYEFGTFLSRIRSS